MSKCELLSMLSVLTIGTVIAVIFIAWNVLIEPGKQSLIWKDETSHYESTKESAQKYSAISASIVIAVLIGIGFHEYATKPLIDIKVVEGGSASDPTRQGETVIYLEMVISNREPDTSLTRWIVSVEVQGKWIEGTTGVFTGAPVTMRNQNGQTRSFPPMTQFIPAVTLKPIKRGEIATGWITAFFKKPSSSFEAQDGMKVRVSCLDAYGHEWSGENALISGGVMDMNSRLPGMQ